MAAKCHDSLSKITAFLSLFLACVTIAACFSLLFFHTRRDAACFPGRRRAFELHKFADQELNRHTCLRHTRNTITHAFKDLFVGKTYVALVGVPLHDNYGDTFIWDGEQRLSEHFGFEISHICAQCQLRPSNIAGCNWTDLSKVIRKPSEWLIIYQGGGNWGTLWARTHQCTLGLLREYLAAGLTVVSMPQSVFYDLNDTVEQVAFASEQTFWEKEAPQLPGKMIMSCRQHDSCDLLARYFPKLQVRRVPDIAFMIPPIYARGEPVIDIVFVVRRDKESVAGHEKNLKVIDGALKGGNVTYEVHDWHQIGKFLPIRAKGQISADPSLKTQGGAEVLSRAKIVVTDRLHGSILSLLMGKYHVYVENTYRKLEETRTMALSHETCTAENLHGFKAKDMEEAVAMALNLLKTHDAMLH